MKRGHITMPYLQHSPTGLRYPQTTGQRNERLFRAGTSLPRAAGVGLVELMVAMVIGLALIAGAVSVFVNSRLTYSTNESVARMQENARYALEELAWDLQLVGYWGRNNTTHLVLGRKGEASEIATAATNDCAAAWYIDLDRPVEGQQGAAVSPYDGTCIPDQEPPGETYYRPNTDVLVIRHADPTPVAALQAGTTYIRSSPTQAKLFVGTTAPSGFSADADDYPLQATAYYVTSYTNTADDGLPALRRATLGPGPEIAVPGEVVIEGVEDLQVQFGIDTNGNGSINQYLDPDEVAANEWDDVRAVRLAVLVRAGTAEAGYTNDTQYNMPGLTADPPNDSFRRLLVTRTVHLRN